MDIRAIQESPSASDIALIRRASLNDALNDIDIVRRVYPEEASGDVAKNVCSLVVTGGEP
jgi:hypothetical protein